MKSDMDHEFGDLGGLAGRLKRADFSGESRVKDVLRESLLGRAERQSRRSAFAWLVPAAVLAAAAVAAVTLWPVPRHGAAAAAYNLASDGYGECGRQGLEDYMAEGRF
jgi:hypothetical protein